MTLYEKIKSMTIEEMATFLSEAWNRADYEDGDYDPSMMAALESQAEDVWPEANKEEQK